MNTQKYIPLFYIAYFIFTTVFSYYINRLFLQFASNLGTRNAPANMVRWSEQTKPSLGGFSFYIVFLLSIIFYLIVFTSEVGVLNTQVLGILTAGTLSFIMGLTDDAYNTQPLLKLVAQITCAVILIITGTYISIFSNDYINFGLTILWIVGIMNSINMLDNMDSISTLSSIAIILNIVFIIFVLGNLSNNIYLIVLLSVLCGLVGFIPFNWNPAKMFMGDTGSQFLGFFLGAFGITYLWNTGDTQGEFIMSKQLIITTLTFSIPIIDTTSVVINRLLKGGSPFIGGKDHTTHSLHLMGISEKNIARIYFLIGSSSMLFNYFILTTNQWGLYHVLGFSTYFIVIFILLYLPTRKNPN